MGKIKPRVSTEAQIDVVVARCAQLWRGDSRKEFSAYCEEQLRRRGYPVTMLALAAIRTARAELFADRPAEGARSMRMPVGEAAEYARASLIHSADQGRG